MNTNGLDFHKIRTYKGSQNNAFEELICQLARLSCPENADYFVRKEGSGGDAGVECFWKLKDGSEHGWQAKYFFELGVSQWKQISDSVKTALEKHPKLRKYYICLPLNRTNQRKENQESQLDKWHKKETEWKEIAEQKEMNVIFEFWGASEIVGMLSTDNPHFSGRALYWFNSHILQIPHLNDIAKKAKKSLGDRFSPELNIELPIAKFFDGIGLTPNWHQRFYSITEEWLKALEELKVAIAEQKGLLKEKIWNPIKAHTLELETFLKQTIKANSLYENIGALAKSIYNLIKNIKTIEMDCKETETVKKINWYFNRFSEATYKVEEFLLSKDMMAFSKKSMLLLGDAGAGKSHLLCDITLNRLKDELPTLFLLGQHYEGGNPLKFISDSLDLRDKSNKEILGALDALGETYSTRTLIIIDAINEGPHKEDWKNHIIKLITELKEYPHIGFVFSCRSTYLQYLLPTQIREMTVEIKHRGFDDPNHQAIYRYIEKQGIFVPSALVMNPEFINPLFLKICCESLKSKGKKEFPTGLEGVREIFKSYVDTVSETINKNKQYRTGETIVSKALQAFALQLFPDNLSGLPIDKAREIMKLSDPKKNEGEELIDELLDEGILSEDIYKDGPIIRFTYERFSDYFIAESLMQEHIIKKPLSFLEKATNKLKFLFYKTLFKIPFHLKTENLKPYFKKKTPIGDIFVNKNIYFLQGIIEALYVCIAEHFKVELFDVIDYTAKKRSLKPHKSPKNGDALRTEESKKRWLMDAVFKNSALWRSPNSFTLRTDELLSQIRPIYFSSPILEILLKLSIKPEHPWNADLLHKVLIGKTLAERDKFWSIHIFSSYHYGEDLTIKNLIDWPYSTHSGNLESECARLYAITLIWFTTSSHRELRDKATKSAIIILSKYPEHLLKLMDQFADVNDLYVRERLYAIAYGVAVNIEDKKLIKKIAEKTYGQLFKMGKPVPHILLRDYARCILEFACKQKLLSKEINPESFRPPYKSDWPIENPMDSEINAFVGDDESGAIHHSLMGHSGDFGIYTMNCVHSFSPTPLTKKHPETGKELQGKFIDRLSEEQKALYHSSLRKSNFVEKQQEEQIHSLKEKFKNEFGKDFDEEYIHMIRADKKHNLYDKYLRQYNSLGRKHREQSLKEKNRFIETLDEEQREHFRWLFEDRFMNDRPAAFSRKWAKRWVYKQVYEMGWRKKLFEEFDKNYVSSLRYRKKAFERIGKKYQWMAFHTLLAHLADNVHYIGQYDDKNKYEGPWQFFKRDIDPTCCLRKTGGNHQLDNTANCWWQPHLTQFPEKTIEKQEEWFKSTDNTPDFKNLLQVQDPDNNNLCWTVLFNYVVQQKDISQIKTAKADCHTLELWFRINTIVVLEKDRKVFLKGIKNKDLCGFYDLIDGQIGFLKEHPNKNNEIKDEWRAELQTNNGVCEIKHFVPVSHYTWESEDHSMDKGISFYLPSQILIDKLNLCYPPGQYKYWKDKNNYPVFTDPSICSVGPSSALIKTDILNSWLAQEKLCLVWLIGGEKRLYGTDYSGKRHDFSGVYFTDNDQIKGDIWFLDMSSWGR